MELEPYFKAYEKTKIPYKMGKLDQFGIPLFDPVKLNLEGSLSYHPIVITQYGLAHFNQYLNNNSSDNLDVALKCADWFVENGTIEPNKKFLIFPYHFDLKNPPIKAPWYSGMAQGQILSLLFRAYQRTKKSEYLITGNKLAKSFNYSIEENGCNSYLNGYLFIQEIAHKPALYILNGALYAIIGLWEWQSLETGKKSPQQFNQFVKGVEALLPSYDLGVWTKYSLGMRFNLADLYYQKLHAEQLLFLGERIKNPIFINYGEKFKNQYLRFKHLMRPILFISLQINRAFRVFGLGKLLYKFPI